MYPRSMFRAKIRKIYHFSSENYRYSREILQYIARPCLRNEYCIVRDCSIVLSATAVLYCPRLQYCIVHDHSTVLSATAVLYCPRLQYCIVHDCSTVLSATALSIVLLATAGPLSP